MRTDTGQVIRLEDYRPSDYLIPRVNLAFRLSPESTLVKAVLTVERREGTALTVPLVLDGDGLSLRRLALDGKELDQAAYDATPDRLTIHVPPVARQFELEIETEVNAAANQALMGLYRSGGVYCTQCEAEGFRRITYFLDRPDILSVYTVRIEARRVEAPLLLSNGNPVESGDLANGWHFAVWHDPFPKPSYLFALVAGDLGKLSDQFTTMSGRSVDLAIYVEHGKEPLAAYAMDALKRAMAWDEKVFGREYDLDVFNIVAVSDFNMGAMENKGLNIFNDKYVLADRETATDADFANIEAIIAHEYFHNWTGNRITCRDWFQLCLKEGLTVFRDHEFSADQRSRPVKRIWEVRTLKSLQFPEDQGPLAHPVRPRRYREINNFYTATVYEKGSEVVRMIRTILGAKKFRAGMDLYFERHDGEAATIEDFLKAFEDVSGQDLSQFALWYNQAGTPHVAVTSRYDQAERKFILDIVQSLPPTPSESRKRLMHIPLAFGLVGPDGKDMEATAVEGATVEHGVIHIRKRKHRVTFSGIAARPVLSFNRGFSAPVNLSVEQKPDDLFFLALHDSDLFCRWQAANMLFTGALIAAYRTLRGGARPEFEARLAELAEHMAGDATLEPAFRALALTLPSEADMARELGSDIDPDAILAARVALAREIASANQKHFRQLYDDLADGGDFSPDAASAGRRALRIALLDHLVVLPEGAGLAASHFHSATNMTDRAASLSALLRHHDGSPEADAALDAFEKRHSGHALAMDKWFQIQAAAPGPRAVERVKALTGHPAFSITNPNRVRALIGTLANANQTGFHSANGEGYRFVAATITDIDRRNPQLAARLATAFRSWRSLEPGRQAHARHALLSMKDAGNVSIDLSDIVERTLA